jgi:N-acetylmuramoyl-L-alanine amidase
MRSKNFRNFLKLFIFPVLLGFWISGCATAPGTGRKIDLSLKELCERYKVQLDWDSVAQVATLRGYDLKARVLTGSDVVVVGKDKVMLSGKIRSVRGEIMVPADFEEKVMGYFKAVAQAETQVPKVRKIIIDPGHGGKDPGAISKSGLKEKTVVLDIAQRVARILKDNRIDVQMTRESDEFISLEKRTEIASQGGADLFVSIHANSHPSKSVDGAEVYYMGDYSARDKNEEQRKKNQRILFPHLSMVQDSPELDKIVADMLYAYKQVESKPLAAEVLKDLGKTVGVSERGFKHDRFFVLRNTLIPAILIEVGYLTNAKEEKLLETDEYRQKIADGIAQSLLDYAKQS